MKKNLFIIMIIVMISFMSSTTVCASTTTIPTTLLTEEQKIHLASEQVTNTIEQYGKWIGLGKEIGTAVDESLGALSNRANEFSQTRVGIFTMFLVAYKILGTDLIQLVFGLLFCISSLTMCGLSFWKHTMIRKIAIKKKGFFLWGEREYQIINSNSEQMWGHAIVAFIIVILSCIIIFV